MYSIKYRSLLQYLGTSFAYLYPHSLQTLSCSRAASALVCSLHVADVPEEFVTELAGFCNICLSNELRGRLFRVGDEGGNKTRR